MASGIKCVSCNQRINLPPQASGTVTCPMCKTSQPVPEQQGKNSPQIGNAPVTSTRPMEARPTSNPNPYSSPQVHPEVDSNFESPKGRFPGWAVAGCLLVSVLLICALLMLYAAMRAF